MPDDLGAGLALPGSDTKSLVRQLMGQIGQGAKTAETGIADMSKISAQQAALSKAQSAEMAPGQEKLTQTLQNVPAAPKGVPMPEAPKGIQIDPKELNDTMSMMVAFAALGGALTRQPMTAALNSFAAGVHGLVQGKQQVFDDSLKTFKANFDTAKAKNDQIWKEWQTALETHKNDVQAQQNALAIIASKYQLQNESLLIQKGDVVSATNLRMKAGDTATKATEGLVKIEEMAQTRRIQMAALQQQRETMNELARDRLGQGERRIDIAEKKAAATGAGGKTNTRNALVQAASRNALDRLGEMKQPDGTFPTTSVMFGQHGEGVISRGIHAVGQAALSPEQQKVDAGYASMIDEAIPAFTGGLRGSDAFRKFLLGQLPGPGDTQETANEKMRLFEANIKGTMNTFGSVYAATPTFQAAGGAPAAAPEGGGWSIKPIP